MDQRVFDGSTDGAARCTNARARCTDGFTDRCADAFTFCSANGDADEWTGSNEPARPNRRSQHGSTDGAARCTDARARCTDGFTDRIADALTFCSANGDADEWTGSNEPARRSPQAQPLD